jgi:hypothetical protein
VTDPRPRFIRRFSFPFSALRSPSHFDFSFARFILSLSYVESGFRLSFCPGLTCCRSDLALSRCREPGRESSFSFCFPASALPPAAGAARVHFFPLSVSGFRAPDSIFPLGLQAHAGSRFQSPLLALRTWCSIRFLCHAFCSCWMPGLFSL